MSYLRVDGHITSSSCTVIETISNLVGWRGERRVEVVDGILSWRGNHDNDSNCHPDNEVPLGRWLLHGGVIHKRLGIVIVMELVV